MNKITLTSAQYRALPEVCARYWPDDGERVEIEEAPNDAVLVRVFNRGLNPRSVLLAANGRERA